MKIRNTVLLFFILMILIQSSCITRKKLTYLKFTENIDNNIVTESNMLLHVTPATYKIMPFDILYIRVITPDPQWSTVFNIMPVGAGGAFTQESASLIGYPVDDKGNIEIPFVGKVQAGGKTLTDLKIELDSVFINYLSDAAITIRLVNNYVSVLGEVSRPGRYALTKDRVNIFEVISMAGDLSEFSDRQRIQLIRPSQYGPIVKEFSLADRSILSSEFYYIMPNDIIYSRPISGRSFRINSSVWSLFLSTITSALGVIAFFRTLP